ncbi:hypothetical protein, partial [Bacteroides uniformis]|uniref:hypothetical protein n=1 Tax=Bacteroides uniformis TaxID=820 RepID=UPI003F253275
LKVNAFLANIQEGRSLFCGDYELFRLEVDSNVYQARRDSCATDKSGTPVSMTNVPCPCRRTLRQIGRSRHVCHIQYA